jgi:pyruvate/2-oxoglutarate dehydrogenase complex dihydrolipoamide acyltransferase (E2) component
MAEKGLNCGINKTSIMTTKITVPDIGDFKNVEVIEILTKPGDIIKKDDSVVTLESDKSSVEVPSPFAGKISSLKVKIGDKVSKGSVLAIIGDEKVEISKKTEKADKQKKEKIRPLILKEEKILPETEKIIKEAESAITQKLIKEPTIQEFEIKDILSAVDSISKIEKKKSKIVEKKDFADKDDVLTLNNQAKTNKSEILVLDQMIE